MNTHADALFALESLKVFPARNQIQWLDEIRTLQPKVMAVLLYLAENQKRVVSGDELLDELWKGRIVTPGSVQKSMNSLRKALAEVFGEREIVAHYSKRGYQLLIEPTFFSEIVEPSGKSEIELAGISEIENDDEKIALNESVYPKLKLNKKYIFGVLASCVIVISVLFYAFSPKSKSKLESSLPESHGSLPAFDKISVLTDSTYREVLIKPHVDNKNFAYVRQSLASKKEWKIDSQLMIRNAKGDDWQIAVTQGSWELLSWSPNGRYLVAIERWQENTGKTTPDFYVPDTYLYTFHIFELDLETSRLIEKFLLSQWQGKIDSLTWWDQDTLEFVATQGISGKPEPYRYSIIEQTLVEAEYRLLNVKIMQTQVLNQYVALVVQDKHVFRLELLDETQKVRRTWQLENEDVEMSWLPDATGVLVYQPDTQKLSVYYWDGNSVGIDLENSSSKIISNPVFKGDGKGIYYVQEGKHRSIEMVNHNKFETFLSHYATDDQFAISSDAKQWVYTQQINGQRYLWLHNAEGQESQLMQQPLSQALTHLLWSSDERWIVYKMAKQVFFYSLETGEQKILGLESSFIDPLAYYPDLDLLFVLNGSKDVTNLWRLDVKTLESKQITFGDISGALMAQNEIFFQYKGKQGLWKFSTNNLLPKSVSSVLPANSKLLNVNQEKMYFVTGGECRESAIQMLDFNSEKISDVYQREQASVKSFVFHPDKGIIQAQCQLAPSELILAE